MNIKQACASAKILQKAMPPTQSALVSCGILRRVKKGEFIFWDHSDVEQFSFLIQGTAALYKLNHQQEKKVIFICGQGELLNEVIIQQEFSSVSCEMLSDGMILSFPAKQFSQLMAGDYSLAKAFMDSMAIKVRRLYRQLKNTSNTMCLNKQIASKLWKLAKDHGIDCEDGVEINFNLSISFLADLVGSKRETVSKQVKYLSQLGLIYVRKGRFVIRDLNELANFCEET